MNRSICIVSGCLLLAATLACSPTDDSARAGSDAEVVADLTAELAFADVTVEPRDLAVGTPAGREFLGGGWSRNESPANGEPFVWAVGPASQVLVPILEPRDRELVIDARPFTFPNAPVQTLAVEVDGVAVGEVITIRPGRAVYRVAIEAATWRPGLNEIALLWGSHHAPADVLGSGDRRSLAAAVHRLALVQPGGDVGTADSTLPSAPRADEATLWLPWGSQVDTYLDVPGGAELVIDGVQARGVGGLTVEWSMGADAEGEPVQASIESGAVQLTAPDAPGPVRLRLSARSTSPEPGGLRLRNPRVVIPRRQAAAGDEDAPIESPSAVPSEGATESTSARRSVVLWVVDTLRADRLGAHGGPVPTPHLDALVSESLMFERAIAQSSWTKASMGTVFTGRWPLEHGAYGRDHVLGNPAITMAELLSAAGYRTAAFGTNPNLTATFGFDQGFDHFVDLGEAAHGGEVVDAAAAWLADTERDRPIFLWLHAIDPHSPYVPPEAFRQRYSPHLSAELARQSRPLINDMRAGRRPVDPELVEQIVGLYDTEIAWSDRALGRLRETLSEAGLDDALLIVLSDHGEEFYEHGNFEHGRALFAESVHVPFVLHWPGGPIGRVREAVQHLDVLPTVLDIVGVAAPYELEGRSLATGAPDAARPIFSHLHLDGAERVAVEHGRFKLMAEVAAGDRLVARRLFDIVADPTETRDILAEQPIVAGWLATLMRQRLARARDGASVETVEIDDETRRRLEALGYL